MSELLIHIGLPKTGTTAVQGVLFNNRGSLARRGVFYPDTFTDNVRDEGRWAHHLHAHKWGGWIEAKGFQIQPDDAWKALRKEINEKPGRYIVSSERFADILSESWGKDVLEFLIGLFPDIRVRFIVYVRRQDVLAESFLKQRVKVGLQKEPMESYLSNLPAFLNFDFLLSRLAEYVGWENIIVRPYARNKLIDNDAAIDFLHMLGLDDLKSEIYEPITANQSIQSLTTSVLLKLEASNVLRNAADLKPVLRKFFEMDEFDHLNEQSLFDEKTRSTLMSRYEDGNRAIAKKLQSKDLMEEIMLPDQQVNGSLGPDQKVISVEQLLRLLEQVTSVQKESLWREFQRQERGRRALEEQEPQAEADQSRKKQSQQFLIHKLQQIGRMIRKLPIVS